MKDAYSFDANVAQPRRESYDAMYEAYCRIYRSLRDSRTLSSRPRAAPSAETVRTSSWSRRRPARIRSSSVSRAATPPTSNAEIGPGAAANTPDASAPTWEKVATPNNRTIQEVCDFLKVPQESSAKLLVFLADGKPVSVLIRGDHEGNEAKIRRAFGATTLVAADAPAIEKATGAPMGFLGPVAIKIPLIVDRSVAAMSATVVGGNEVDVHLKGVVPGRDFALDRVADLRNAGAGDACPRCGKAMIVRQGIEIGHVFKLGTKYSKAMGAKFLDDKGNETPIIMGCYGIGVSRLVAAAVEAGHDDNGILWPLAIAPYEVVLVPLQTQSAAVMEAAESLVTQFEAAGVDVLMDDREQRPGVKFKDADLIGIPLRVVVGERGLKEGTIEVKWRNEAAAHHVPAASAGAAILAELASAHEVLRDTQRERRASRASGRREG